MTIQHIASIAILIAGVIGVIAIMQPWDLD